MFFAFTSNGVSLGYRAAVMAMLGFGLVLLPIITWFVVVLKLINTPHGIVRRSYYVALLLSITTSISYFVSLGLMLGPSMQALREAKVGTFFYVMLVPQCIVGSLAMPIAIYSSWQTRPTIRHAPANAHNAFPADTRADPGFRFQPDDDPRSPRDNRAAQAYRSRSWGDYMSADSARMEGQYRERNQDVSSEDMQAQDEFWVQHLGGQLDTLNLPPAARPHNAF